MIEKELNEFIRLVGSLSLDQSGKQRIVDCLSRSDASRKEFSGKYVAVASAVAFLAVGTIFLARGMKQDINIM